jgi:hypothetical protein
MPASEVQAMELQCPGENSTPAPVLSIGNP